MGPTTGDGDALDSWSAWKEVDVDFDLGKRVYVPVEVLANCPVCGEESSTDDVPLEYGGAGLNRFEIWCFNEECDNYDRDIIGVALIDLQVTIQARVSYE